MRPMRLVPRGAALFALSIVPSIAGGARADAIPAGHPPNVCPPGAVGGMGHGSCVISACAADDACPSGERCETVRYCSHDYGRQVYVRDACTTEADCTVPGDTCREARACVSGASTAVAAAPSASPPTRCACTAAAPVRPPLVLAIGALVPVSLVTARRRRRRG